MRLTCATSVRHVLPLRPIAMLPTYAMPYHAMPCTMVWVWVWGMGMGALLPHAVLCTVLCTVHVAHDVVLYVL